MRRKLTGINTILIVSVWAGSAALTACNGWPRAGEFSEAQNKPEKYPSYAAASHEPAPFEFGGRHWIVSPGTVELIGARLQSVGTAGNVTVYSRTGAQAPYDVLYAPAGGTKWRQVLPID